VVRSGRVCAAHCLLSVCIRVGTYAPLREYTSIRESEYQARRESVKGHAATLMTTKKPVELEVDVSEAALRDPELTSLNTGLPLTLTNRTRLTKLGAGVYGTVYLANTGKEDVAIKVQSNLYEDDWTDEVIDDGVRPASILEASILIKLRHPNVIALLDVLLSPKNLVFILPRARETLYDYSTRKWKESKPGIPLEDVRYIGLQLARGMAYLQSLDVLNGDYKPQNVLIYEEAGCPMRVVIADFGIATLGRCYEPQSYNVYFTLWYRAPELLLDGSYDTAADSWALGCILGELLIGKVLFPGSDESNTLFLIAAKLGIPTAERWPGLSELPKGKQVSATIMAEAGSAKYAFLAPAEYVGDAAVLRRFRYADARDERVGLGPDEQRLLDRLLTWDPRERESVLELVETDSWLEAARARLGGMVCQSAVEVKTVACTAALGTRVGYDAHDPTTDRWAKAMMYTWLVRLVAKHKGSDRDLALTVYLSERYRTVTADTSVSDLALTLLACFKIATDLVERSLVGIRSLAREEGSAGGKDDPTRLPRMIRTVIRRLGVDLNVATAYDVAREYGLSYSTLVQQTVRTLMILSYFSGVADQRDAELVGLCVVALACQVVGEPFRHADVMKEQFGSGRVVDTVVAFGRGLQQTFVVLDDRYRRKVLTVSQRGPIDGRSVLRSAKALSAFISPEYIAEEAKTARKDDVLAEALARLSIKP
jgi:negative regulator of PHO system